MDDPSDSTADPPAYTAAAPRSHTTLRRTIEDTRQMILANVWMITGNMRVGQVDIVVGKTRPKPPTSSSGARSFVSTTSQVTIRVAGQPSSEPPAESSASARRPSAAAAYPPGKHYAAVVARSTDPQVAKIDMVLQGEPQDTVEDALESLLDDSQGLVTDMLANHRKQVLPVCCRACGQALRGY